MRPSRISKSVTTTSAQETAPRVAANANGDYVVVWVSTAVDPTGNIMMQRYDRFGRTLGTEYASQFLPGDNPARIADSADPARRGDGRRTATSS